MTLFFKEAVAMVSTSQRDWACGQLRDGSALAATGVCSEATGVRGPLPGLSGQPGRSAEGGVRCLQAET